VADPRRGRVSEWLGGEPARIESSDRGKSDD